MGMQEGFFIKPFNRREPVSIMWAQRVRDIQG
jgi:hypothetical protein